MKLADEGQTGVMVTLERKSNQPYKATTSTAKLCDVAVRAKPMPENFLNAEGNFPSEAFFEYARPLVGELPQYAELKYAPAK